MTPDGVLPIAQGSGENGKSCVLTDGILPALGDYAAPASPKLIAANTTEHSTERADLRGQRFLIAEELTENRTLNVTAIKQIQDVSRIKARYLYKDNVTFNASHSLFITTNYRPVVTETDHGTWRRLALVVFPYTYRKPGEPRLAPTDRLGDPQLKARLRAGVEGQHDAVVTWAVEGARRWYATGMPSLPPSVEADTREWRIDADRILGFWDDRLIADPETGVVTTELHAAFNTWMDSNGHTRWPKELFGSRFRSHAETTRHHVVERRPVTVMRCGSRARQDRPPVCPPGRASTSASDFGSPVRSTKTLEKMARGPTGPTTRELLPRGTMLRRLNRGWAAWTTSAAKARHYSSSASCVGVHPPTGVTTRQRARKPRGHEEAGALTTVHGGGLLVIAGTLRLRRSERPHPSWLPVASHATAATLSCRREDPRAPIRV